MKTINITELEQYIDELNKKYNIQASITEQGQHIAIFPPQGGMWVTAWFLNINNKKIFIGSEYNVISIEELKSKIEEIIKEEVL
jgi:hypothetical protein